jgi:Uma2 family endonuclease
MIQVAQNTIQLPRTLAEFMEWDQHDDFKYEWNDGELIQFTGMKKKELRIYDLLLDLFIERGCKKKGTFIAEQNVMLSGIQLRRPDIAYFTKKQIYQDSENEDVIPEFIIEIISSNDQINQLETKITAYFKAGVKVVWSILPEQQMVYIYTSRRDVRVCIENDVCSAQPVLPEFEISVATIFSV